ncbi:MAG: ABC transporter ATP-binding protein/permease [Defluviitaleaceae bacterium]|nr:ABC transporter ATP-binding protein/permease [Defluviitaleaceae bacterium]
MLKLLKYFGKPFLPLFLVAFVLLVARATLELSLPNLMSDIVDVGIAQWGIDYTVPTQLSAATWGDIALALPDHLYEEFLGWSYIYISDELSQAITNIIATFEYGSPYFDPATTQMLAIRFIRGEYTRLGIDVDAMQMDYVWSTGTLMITLVFISVATAIAQGFMSSRIATGLARNIRNAIFEKVTKFNNASYSRFSTASLITRSTNDVQQIQQLMAIAVRIVVFSPIMAIGGILMVLGTDASMAWVIALAVGSIVTFILLFIIISTPKFKIMQGLIDKVNLVTREGLTGIMVIRAFNTQNHEAERFDGVNSKLQKTALFLARLGAAQMPVITLIMGFTNILIVWIGAGSIQGGGLAVGDMMAFIGYTMFIVWSFLMLAMVIMMLPRATVAANRIMEIINTDETVQDPKDPQAIPKDAGTVEFKNVDFKFAGASGNALTDISFTAKTGEMTAIVGSTGAGKTALVNLIPRFYDSTAGQVLINGVNVRDAKQEELREIVGYVPQKALLFSGTIESNIKYAGDDIDDAAMKKAAEIAQGLEFINEKPKGFKEEIAQGGTNVSGGQRQRLSIARTIAKNPKIYIFDDSFSALDYKTDAELRAAIQKEIKDATLIVVAQRINTIKNANQIIVLDEGRVVGKGTHEELLQNCDVYKQIAMSQLSSKELGI